MDSTAERQADVDRLAEIDAEVLKAEQAVEKVETEVLEARVALSVAEVALAEALFASTELN